MTLNYRFAIVGDPHIGLPHTIWDHPNRFHLIEVSIPALEQILDHLCQLEIDFLLLPGDLTQHGERENHTWLAQRLAALPFPTYVVPGNHDIPVSTSDHERIGPADFPGFYPKAGYENPARLHYSCVPVPGIRLIGLNSNWFDEQGKQHGFLDSAQLAWLQQEIQQVSEAFTLVMIHHNVIEHLPDQAKHPLSQRYMLANAADLLAVLQANPATHKVIITGHLHVQDIVAQGPIWEITTGSLVSYPHPYRLCRFTETPTGQFQLSVESPRIQSVPNWPELQHQSREWMGNHSEKFMLRLLMAPPFNLAPETAAPYLADLRYFWATIADGDPQFDFPHFPARMQDYFKRFRIAQQPSGQPLLQDNQTTLIFQA